MNNKHIIRFPLGTLVEFQTLKSTLGKLPLKQHIIYGIVVGHTKLNVKVLLPESYLGDKIITTSATRLKTVQRPYKKINV